MDASTHTEVRSAAPPTSDSAVTTQDIRVHISKRGSTLGANSGIQLPLVQKQSKPSSSSPIPAQSTILFANRRSGGNKGQRVISAFESVLGRDRVFDLSALGAGGVDEKLESFVDESRVPGIGVRVVVCGGDGTMGWILAAIDRVKHKHEITDNVPTVQAQNDRLPCKFHVAMMPLGTGNDLSRSFGWGGTFCSSMCERAWVERHVSSARPAQVDRWKVLVWPETVQDHTPDSELPPVMTVHREIVHPTRGSIHKVTREGQSMSGAMRRESAAALTLGHTEADDEPEFYSGVYCNYFSVGMDAHVAYAFHRKRNANPRLLSSPLRNQLQYALMGASVAGACSCFSACCGRCCAPSQPYLASNGARLFVRGRGETGDDWQSRETPIPRNARALLFLNLQSYGGGRNLWGRSRACCCADDSLQLAPDDGVLEIVAFTHAARMGCIMGCNKLLGTRAVRVAQGTEIKLELPNASYMQVDGEPWLQRRCIVQISLLPDKALVLRKTT